MGRVQITDKDMGYKALFAAWRKSKVLRVGIFGAKGEAQHPEAGMDHIDLGTVHEYGADNIPARPFIRPTYDENLRHIESIVEGIVKRSVDRPSIDGYVIKELEDLGRELQGKVVKRIRSNIPPPLSPRTRPDAVPRIALIDTGSLLDSIDYEVAEER